MNSLSKLSLKQLQLLTTVDKHTASVVIGNANRGKNGVVKVIHHDSRDGLVPFNEPVTQHRGPVGNQREALRKSYKRLGPCKCPNCEKRGFSYGIRDSFERWCYMCGYRWQGDTRS